MKTDPNEFRFSRGVGERLRFFVYALVDPRDKMPFYIGKGKENRPFAHPRHSRKAESPKNSRILAIKNAGEKVGIVVICHGLTDEEATSREAVVIACLTHAGVRLTNKVAGKHGDELWLDKDEVNRRFGAKRRKLRDPCILVSLKATYKSGLDEDELRKITCYRWGFQDPRSSKSRASRAIYILGVYGGVVRTAYTINHGTWKISIDEKGRTRWHCVGLPAPKVIRAYAGETPADVTEYLPAAQWRFKYVNCDVPKR